MGRVILVLVCALASCSSEAFELRDPSNDADVDIDTQAEPIDAGTTNDMAAVRRRDTGFARKEPYISDFKYLELGFRPRVIRFHVDGTISNAMNAISGNMQRLSAEHAEAFETQHLGPETLTRMREGWGCREVSSGDAKGPEASLTPFTTYWFEVRIQDHGGTLETRDITGCVLAGDPWVTEVIEALELLDLLYL